MFKVTAHPLPQNTLWVKYDPDWAKRKETICSVLVISDIQMDGMMDRRNNRLMTISHLYIEALIMDNRERERERGNYI